MVNTSTITVSYGGETDTFEVTVSTHLLYSLENRAFSSETITTDLNLCETDHDFSIAGDFTLTSSPPSGNGSGYRFIALVNTAGDGYSITLGKGTGSATTYAMGFMGTTTASISSVGTGRHRFVYTHKSGSGKANLKIRKDTGTASSYSASGTFAASTRALSLGQGSTTNVLPTGTINKVYVYDVVMTSDQIDDFLGL